MQERKKHTAVVVDLGATNLRVALVDRKGKISRKTTVRTIRKGPSGTIVTHQIIGQIKKILLGYKGDLAGIGVSAAGRLDIKMGLVLNHNIGFRKIPIVRPIKSVFRRPVILLNDANAAALTEYTFGAGRKKKNLVYITISSGIGGGVIVNDNLLLGRSGNAGEVGHWHVDSTFGLLCSCKKGTGHWEGCASGENIPRFFEAWCAKEKIIRKRFRMTSTMDIFSFAKKGNKTALEFLKVLGVINGRGISNVIAAYDPEVIVLGGSVVLQNQKIILKNLLKNIDHYLTPLPQISVTKFGDDVSLVGASVAVFAKK